MLFFPAKPHQNYFLFFKERPFIQKELAILFSQINVLFNFLERDFSFQKVLFFFPSGRVTVSHIFISSLSEFFCSFISLIGIEDLLVLFLIFYIFSHDRSDKGANKLLFELPFSTFEESDSRARRARREVKEGDWSKSRECSQPLHRKGSPSTTRLWPGMCFSCTWISDSETCFPCGFLVLLHF